MSFAELEYDSKKRRTRREIFLEKMEESDGREADGRCPASHEEVLGTLNLQACMERAMDGLQVSAPGSDLSRGMRVAAMMSGMGRQFDGFLRRVRSCSTAARVPTGNENWIGRFSERCPRCSLHQRIRCRAPEGIVRWATAPVA